MGGTALGRASEHQDVRLVTARRPGQRALVRFLIAQVCQDMAYLFCDLIV